MLAGLPPGTQAQIMRRLAARLEHTPLGRGAVRSALADVIEHSAAPRPVGAAAGAAPAGRRWSARRCPHRGSPSAGRPLACSTPLGYASAYQLTLSSTLPGLGVELHSCYLGHPAADRTAAAHLQLSPRDAPRVRLVEHEPSALPVRDARRRCLLDHLAELRALVAAATGREVRVDVDDAALERVDRA